MNGGTRWLLFPGICLEDQEAPAELRFLYKAYYDRTGVQEETDGRTRARMLLVASQNGNFSEENILDTIPVGECTMDYQEYVLDLSRWTRQLYFALVMDNQELSLGVDPYVWFVLDSVDIRYTEGTPCLAVEDIDQYDLSAYGITLSWTGYSSEYGIYYTDQAAGETDTVYTDRTEYVLDGLNPGTLYTYRIQSFCEPGHRSPGPLSEEGFFTTANICAVPSDFRVIATSWRSVTIFMAAEMARRSRATGCCRSRSWRQRFSMSRSIWSMEEVMSMAALAVDSSSLERLSVTTSMASWAVRAMAVSSSLSSRSSASKVFLMSYPNLPVI